MYLLDTDRMISYLNGRPDARAVIAPLVDDGLAISVVTYGEALEGFLARSVGQRRRRILGEFIRLVVVLDVTFAIAERYAALRARLRATGQLLADHELWIAATAMEHDLTLISRARHFARIPTLKRYAEEPA